MAREDAPPFELGQTYFQGNTPDLAVGNHLLGKVWMFEDILLNAPGSGGTAKPRRTGVYKHMMAVRNTSGAPQLPKLLAKMKINGALYEWTQESDAYGVAPGDWCFPIDEFLPAAGVIANDIYWVCVGGPATVITAAAGTTTVAIGGAVIPATGGKVVAQDTTVITAPAIYNQLQSVGRAILPVAAINTDLLILVTPIKIL